MKTKFVVVDENDTVIGAKPKAEIDGKKLLYRVAALWIKNSKGESLLARRAYTKTHFPGAWGPAAAGTVEKGETYETNIIKEVEEELGLANLTIKKGPKTRAYKYPHFTQYFSCMLDVGVEELRLQEEEVAEVKWFTKEELQEHAQNNPEEFTETMRWYIQKFL